ncbi:unnamed protein product [Caenorhabditis auriculariae]|uniref:Uncharacterized protein n=1 Tax=Caenorhabditis auriculariae TaxID=2777116 RepID=A0A8S1HTP2_9PELO|nr:unnamed protein product [Caenorhabditis auriculariae]
MPSRCTSLPVQHLETSRQDKQTDPISAGHTTQRFQIFFYILLLFELDQLLQQALLALRSSSKAVQKIGKLTFECIQDFNSFEVVLKEVELFRLGLSSNSCIKSSETGSSRSHNLDQILQQALLELRLSTRAVQALKFFRSLVFSITCYFLSLTSFSNNVILTRWRLELSKDRQKYKNGWLGRRSLFSPSHPPTS